MASEMMRVLDLLKVTKAELKAKSQELERMRDLKVKLVTAQQELVKEVTEKEDRVAEARRVVQDLLDSKEASKIRAEAIDTVYHEVSDQLRSVSDQIKQLNEATTSAIETRSAELQAHATSINLDAFRRDVQAEAEKVQSRRRDLRVTLMKKRSELEELDDLEEELSKAKSRLEKTKEENETLLQSRATLDATLTELKVQEGHIISTKVKLEEEEPRVMAELRRKIALVQRVRDPEVKVKVAQGVTRNSVTSDQQVASVPVDSASYPKGFQKLSVTKDSEEDHSKQSRFTFKPFNSNR